MLYLFLAGATGYIIWRAMGSKPVRRESYEQMGDRHKRQVMHLYDRGLRTYAHSRGRSRPVGVIDSSGNPKVVNIISQ